MPEVLARALNLQLAWNRVKRDLNEGRAFLVHPFLVDWIDADAEAWLAQLREEVAADRYRPSACRICPVPKPHGAVRPGADLAVEDQVVFSALVALIRPQVQATLNWGTPPPDFAYRLRTDANDREWFRPYFQLWKDFDRESLRRIDEGRSFVVTADIAGYYELIDINTLRSDLNGLGVDADALRLLETCLHKWARVPRRGIPQGYSPSDLLGKLYLNAVDLALAGQGFVHLRWVDDFRIFCKTEREARQAMMSLIDLLGARGLVLQSAKTRIRTADAAKKQFHAVHALLEPIRQTFLERLIRAGVLEGPSVTIAELDKVLAEIDLDEPIEILRDAYDTHFRSSDSEFNKTLFHFLLRRLGSAKDDHAGDHAIGLLGAHPEETEAILDYATAIGAIAHVEDVYLGLWENDLAQYDYQTYQVIPWRLRQDVEPGKSFLKLVRCLALEGGSVWYLRSIARAVIGKWGTAADLEQLQSCYPNATSDLERAEVAAALRRMEKGRRNAFLGHIAGDGELCSRAARLIRQDTAP